MHNSAVESQTKCRRLFYAKTNGPLNDSGSPEYLAGDIIGVASGGGALETLTGDDLIIATFNDHDAPTRYGCLEEYYDSIPAAKPVKCDLTKMEACHSACDEFKASHGALHDFVFNRSIELTGGVIPTTAQFREWLKIERVRQRDDSVQLDALSTIETDLDALCGGCDTCLESLLTTRDDAITMRPVPTV